VSLRDGPVALTIGEGPRECQKAEARPAEESKESSSRHHRVMLAGETPGHCRVESCFVPYQWLTAMLTDLDF
jgi:hypothetical protein